jgi:PAS domain S-box-containing protein
MTSGGAAEPEGSSTVGPTEHLRARRDQERALAEERDRLALALAAGGLGLWRWDRTSRTIAWGDGLAEMFGLDPACLPDTIEAWLEIVHPDDRAEVALAMAAASAGRGINRMEYRVVWPDGTVRWLECSGKMTAGDDDVVNGAVGVMADVTARRESLSESELLRDRLELLSTIGLTLAEAPGVDARLAALSEAVVPDLADCCAVHLIDEGGLPVLTTTHHGDPEQRATFEQALVTLTVSPDQPWGPGAVFASGSPELIPDIDGPAALPFREGAPERPRAFGSLELHSLFTVPLRAANHTVGTLALGRTRRDPWTEDDQTLAVEVGRRAGMLLDNATLLDAQRQALAASDAARSRLVLLAELSMALSSTLDLDPVLDRLASLLVPGLADICVVDLQDQIIGDRLAAVAAADPVAKRLFEDAERRLPRRRNPTSSLTRTLESGQPTLIPDCTDEYLSINTPDPEVASIYHRLRLSSILVVPLVVRGGILGAITLLRKEDRHGVASHYAEADIELASQVADRAAVALDNARLYTAERMAAEQLQRGLLPKIAPGPHLAAATRYLPAGSGVGGDWYDLFALPDGSTGIAIGDVMGHDMQAAASMGQLRSVFRSYAFEGADPADVLDRADRLVQTFGMAQLATAFCAQMTRVDEETWELCYANAGHPPPIARLPDGTIRFLDDARSALIGAPQEVRRPHAFLTVPVGSTLLLYTDGLIDRRDRTIDDGLTKLAELVRLTCGPPEDLCDRITTEMADKDRTDDVALLAIALQ